MVWCKLVHCLDKGSINFIRLSKSDGVAAWRALQEKDRSTERPRIKALLTQLTTLEMNSGEFISDYLTRADVCKLDLKEAGEKTSPQCSLPWC